jgi:hypothetical protein
MFKPENLGVFVEIIIKEKNIFCVTAYEALRLRISTVAGNMGATKFNY